MPRKRPGVPRHGTPNGAAFRTSAVSALYPLSSGARNESEAGAMKVATTCRNGEALLLKSERENW